MKYKIKRIIVLIFTILLFFSITYIGNKMVFANQTDERVEEDTATDSLITLKLEWEDTQFKNETSYNLEEYRSVTNAVKMKVTYSSTQISEKAYDAGELIIVLKGIGNVNRFGAIEALVGADKESSSTKKHDWTYTWNSLNDTYTFTNNQEIKANSVLSGYFELVWSVNARDSIHGYSQDDVQAILYLADGSYVESEKLSFHNKTKVDTFETYIEHEDMYSYEGLTDKIENPEEYVFIRYNLGAMTTKNSRGLKNGDYYYFNPDYTGVGAGAIVISPILSYTEHSDGIGGRVKLTYDNSNISTQLNKQYIFVAYPKSEYSEKNVVASLEKYGDYYEGNEEGEMEMQQLAIHTVFVPIPSNFEFVDLDGAIYDFWKDTYYDKYVSEAITQEKGGDINGTKMKTGTIEQFYLEGSLNNPDGIAYTLEIVDDFLYILKKNGTYRQLESNEYEFKEVVIPGTSSLINLNGVSIEENKYYASIYAGTNGENVDLSQMELVSEKLITSKNQTITLPDNTTAIVIVLNHIEESIQQFSIEVKVEFHLKDTSESEEQQQDNLENGQVVNTSFIKLYDDNDVWINDKWTEENYIDDTNLNLAQKDMDIYGNYLDREKDNITFYAGEKNDYEAYTKIDTDENSFNATFTMGAKFSFVEADYPNRFSLYTILPDSLSLSGYNIPEDIWNIMTLSGLDLDEKTLANACVPEIIENYRESGRTYIALHFDFGDRKINQSGNVNARFQIKVDGELLKKSSNVFVKSCVIIDDLISEYTTGKVKDNGSWGDATSLFADIDNDGEIEEVLNYGYSYKSFLYADSSQFQLTKFVKTTYSDGWVQLSKIPYEEYGGNYQYKLSITNGNNISNDIIVIDVLESGANAQWQGVLQSVDLSQVEELGLYGTVYYSEVENPGTLDSNDWTTEMKETVKCVAVDFGESVLKEGEELSIILNMKAPEDTNLKNQVTENDFSASLTMIDSTTGNITTHDSLISNFVQVQLMPSLKTIVVQKVDAENGTILSDAKFNLISKSTGETIDTLKTNEKGYAIFHNVPSDDSYIMREIIAPYGYEIGTDTEVLMDLEEKVIYLTIENKRKTGRIELYKTNNIDSTIQVLGAEYTLYDCDGNIISSAITDENGKIVFKDLEWGTYKIKETESPVGYQMNETEYLVEITRDNVEKVITVNTEDVQEDVYVHLIKYAKTIDGIETQEAVSGATFELVKVYSDNSNKRIGLYVTDSEGKIDITGLSYGDYYFREYRTPLGYESTENVLFSVSPQNKDVTVTVYNKRSSGSIILLKNDNLGNMLSGAKFTLYDETKSNILDTYVTDETGQIVIENLEWGTYYLLEAEAPKGYELDKEWKKVIIDASHLKVVISCMNQTLKGRVVLTKTNEDGTILLSGAEYTLYYNDGTVIQEKLVTDENGQIAIENLEWGTYYFKETIAPVGYGISDETVRFSVNVLNAGLTQYLKVTDPLEARRITLTKSIKANEINFDNGNPTFFFKIEGTDIHGNSHTYYRIVSFDKTYVEANVDVNGYVSQSVTVSSLIAGEYTITEEEHSRYYLSGITDVFNGTINENQVTVDLINNMDAKAIFTNLKYENQGFSDNQMIINVLKKNTKLTALHVSYGTELVDAKTKIDRTMLEVVALYDDGTATVIDDKYTLSIETFPYVNGDYTVVVSYEENGVIRTDDFTVKVSTENTSIVSLTATLKEDVTIPTGAQITSSMFEVIATYNSGLVGILDASDYIVSPDIAPEIDGEFIVTIYLEPTVYTKDSEKNVNTTVKLVAEDVDAVLSTSFKSHVSTSITQLIFTDAVAPEDVTTIDVSIDNDGTVVAWNEGEIMYVSSQRKAKKIKAPKNCGSLFYGKQNMKKINLTMLDTSDATNMYAMFAYNTGLEEINLGENFDASNVQNMEMMFYYCSSLKKIEFGEKFDTSNVTNMARMFFYCTSLIELNVSCFDTSKVTNMYATFYKCVSLTELDVSNFDTSEVTDMRMMFAYCSKLESLNLGNFNTEKVTKMTSMFVNCYVLKLDCSNWNVNKVQSYANFNTNATGVVAPTWVL